MAQTNDKGQSDTHDRNSASGRSKAPKRPDGHSPSGRRGEPHGSGAPADAGGPGRSDSTLTPQSLLLTNAVLYDGDLFEADGTVFIRGGRIVAAGARADVASLVRSETGGPEVQTYDLGGRLVLPGLMNAHHHLYSALAAGLAPAGPMDTFPHILKHLWWRLDSVHDRDSIYYSTLVGLLDALEHGCTTIIDHHASMSYVDGSLETMAQAFEEVGLRGVLCFETSERTGVDAVDEQLAENLAFAERRREDDRVQGMLGMHANLTLSQDTLRHLKAEKPPELPIHIHVGEAPEDLQFCRNDGFAGPLDRLDHFGLLQPESFVIHGIHLDGRDREILRKVRPVVVTNPQSNANNGVGTFDPTVSDRYLLGTDGMTNDMVATLRYHYLSLQERRLSTDHLVDTFFTYRQEVQERFFPDTGKLMPGSRADIAVLDYVPVTPISYDNALIHLIFGVRTARAHMTFVDGRMLYHDGSYTSVDAGAIRTKARQVAEALHRRFEY